MHKQNNTTINILLQNRGNEGKGWVESSVAKRQGNNSL